MFIDDTSEKKKNLKKNHFPESDYESAGEVVFGRLVCYCWYTGWYVLWQLPVIGFTVKIVWCTAALYNNTSVLFKIFPPETESILYNVRKVVLCVNLDSVFWKVFQVSRRTSFPLLIGSANTTFPFNFFSLYFNFFKCFTESDQRFLSQLKPLIVTYYSL